MEIIGEYIGNDISGLSEYEQYFGEGDTGELRLYVDRTLTQGELEQLEIEIRSQGVVLTSSIIQDARVVSIKFQKAIAPLIIIALAVGGLFVAGTSLLGWQLSKSPFGIPWWVWVIGGGVVLYLIFRKPVAKAGRAAGGLAIKASKVYVSRKMPGLIED